MPKSKIIKEDMASEKDIPEKEKESVASKREERKGAIEHPKIRGGICEYCGIPARECNHYKEIFAQGRFRCLCGASFNPSSFEQSIYMYVPEWKAWICNAEGCRRQAELRGGYAKPEILKFYNP
jgi:hypothetical protein